MPNASFAATVMLCDVPAVTVVGRPEMTSKAAEAGVTSNVTLVTPVRSVVEAVSVYPVPTLSMLTFENVATPLTGPTVSVPESMPLPGFVPMVIVIVFVA